MTTESILETLQTLTDRDEKPLNFKEASTYLDVSPSYLYKLTHRNQIPFYKPAGKKIYFLKEDLREYLLRNRTSTEQELEQKAVDIVALKSEAV